MINAIFMQNIIKTHQVEHVFKISRGANITLSNSVSRCVAILIILYTAIVPIIKNKSGNTSNKSNYRPIALVTACSKIFESCLLKMLDHYLETHDHQFGFKSQHATDMCIFTVKSVIKYYTKQNSTVFTCFLDAAKALD